MKPGKATDKQGILAALKGKISKWRMPDDMMFVNAMAHSAMGKVQKLVLRRRFADDRLPG